MLRCHMEEEEEEEEGSRSQSISHSLPHSYVFQFSNWGFWISDLI